jgi:type IV pilus assembly protein PilQ
LPRGAGGRNPGARRGEIGDDRLVRWLFAVLVAAVACGGARSTETAPPPEPEPEIEPEIEIDDLDDSELERAGDSPRADRPRPAATPRAPERVERRGPPVRRAGPIWRGRKIDLNVRNADLVHVFRLLATAGGVSVVIAPDVRGQVTLVLRQVPWDQALDVIARAHQLEVERDGTVLLIRKR